MRLASWLWLQGVAAIAGIWFGVWAVRADPSRKWRSEPHTPHASTATTTSPGAGSGRSMASSRRSPGPWKRRARIGWKCPRCVPPKGD